MVIFGLLHRKSIFLITVEWLRYVFRAHIKIINNNYNHVKLKEVKTAGARHSAVEPQERQLKKQVE